jgi:hypothetical protein
MDTVAINCLTATGTDTKFTITLRMASSGMLRRVALVRTDVSVERSASNIRATRIGELFFTP